MKNILLTVTAFVLINGCAKTHTANQAVTAQGGITGGGGGVIPANPVGAYQIKRIVEESQRDIRMYLKNDQRNYFESKPDEIGDLLYSREKTIFNFLDEVLVEVRMNKPCYDGNGDEVDGSIYASLPNTICISAFRMGQTLINANAYSETLALVIHELSHLVGTNEDQAKVIQAKAAHALSQLNTLFIENHLIYTRNNAGYLGVHLDMLADKADNLSDDDLKKALYGFNEKLMRYYSTVSDTPYHSYFDKREADLQDLNEMKFRLILLYVVSNSHDNLANHSKNEIQKIFKENDLTTLANARSILQGNSNSNTFDNSNIQRLHSRADIIRELKLFSKYLRDVWGYLYQLKIQYRPRVLREQNISDINSWSKYTGSYAATLKICNNDGFDNSGITKFEVFRNANGILRMKYMQNLNEIEDSIEYSEADMTTVFTDGDEIHAVRVAVEGNLWLPKWRRRTFTIQSEKKVLVDKVEFKEKDKFYSSECFYDLNQL